MLRKIAIVFLICGAIHHSKAQNRPAVHSPAPKANGTIISGPMLGYAEHRECMVWLQTQCAKKIKLVWADEQNPAKSGTEWAFNDWLACEPYICRFIIKNLEPGHTYSYKIFGDNVEMKSGFPQKFRTKEHWEWRKDPPNFSFLVGSCTFINDSLYDRPGEPYGQGTAILKNMAESQANMMIWMGDNVYLRETDYSSESGIYARYNQVRANRDLRKLLAGKNNYAIWDDHDFGPNNSCKTFELKEASRRAFMGYWGNKTYGNNGEGVYSKFSWSDCDFFLLDNRWFRDENLLPDSSTNNKTQLGKEQMEWLKQSLISSSATFKFIIMGGQFLNLNTQQESYTMFLKERAEILDFLMKYKINGVMFFSGDRHHTEMIRLPRTDSSLVKSPPTPNGSKKDKGSKNRDSTSEEEEEEIGEGVRQPYTLYELTCSPLSARGSNLARSPEAMNPMRISQTLVTEPNYCQIAVKGKPGNRNLHIKCFDKRNELRWEFTISEQDLVH